MKNTLTYQHTVLASYELQRYNSRQEGFLKGTKMISVIHLSSQHLPALWTPGATSRWLGIMATLDRRNSAILCPAT